jgi:ornithine cyclodeaminase/alanine dehydrogenase-like protein (mu-crystallin family)
MTRLLRDGDVRSLVSFPGAVTAVGRAIVAAAAEPRPVTARSIARFDGGWLRVLSGTLPTEDVVGFKAFHLVPGAGVRYLISLYRLSDGEPLALVDAAYVTTARTSATAAAAAARFWGDEPVRLGLIGTGTMARDGLRALASVCRLVSVAVFSRSPANRDVFVSELGPELGLEIEAAASAAEATRDAAMVMCATQTHGVVALAAEDAGGPRYLSSISSTLPAQRELDGRVIAEAGLLVVDTPDALEESGDLLAAAEAGLDRSRVVSLADWLAGRTPRTEPVVYKSIGSVEQDLALAHALFREADRRGIGTDVDPIESLRS